MSKSITLIFLLLIVLNTSPLPAQQSEGVDLAAMQHWNIVVADDAIASEVIDETGRGIPGICVTHNRWHVHTDPQGYFHWSLENPLPQQATLKVYKRYSGQYEALETTVSLSQLENQPIILPRKR